MNWRLLTTILFSLLILSSLVCAQKESQKTIQSGTRVVKYKEITFQEIGIVSKTKRPKEFTEALNKVYTGGRLDPGNVLGIKSSTSRNYIGAITHGEILTLPATSKSSKGANIQKYHNKLAQFEYFPSKAVMLASEIWIRKYKVKKGNKDIDLLKVMLGAKTIFEQDGIRIKCLYTNKPCMTFNVFEYPDGKKESYLDIYKHADIIKISDRKEDEIKVAGGKLFGLKLLKFKNGIKFIAQPRKRTYIGSLRLSGGSPFLYETNSKNTNVTAKNLQIKSFKDGTVFKVQPGRNNHIMFYIGENRMRVNSGTVAVHTKLRTYSKCKRANKNCINLNRLYHEYNFHLIDNTNFPEIVIIGHNNVRRTINIDKIDGLGSVSVIKPQGKLLFFNGEVNIVGSRKPWHYYQSSFKMDILRKGKKHKLHCLLSAKECILDGRAVLKDQSINICNSESDCNTGEKCFKSICIEYNGLGCKAYKNEGPSSKTLDLFVIGELKFAGYDYLKSQIKAYLEEALKLPPFSHFKYNIYMFGLKNPISQRDNKRGPSIKVINKIKMKYCNFADQTILISSSHFRSNARFDLVRYSISTPMAMAHELGHSIGDLADEYRDDPKDKSTWSTGVNCVTTAKKAKTNFGTTEFRGCGGDCEKGTCGGYYRPSKESIMRDHTISQKFNAISIRSLNNNLRKYAA